MKRQLHSTAYSDHSQDISSQDAPAKPVRWPNNLSDAEFDALIDRLDLDFDGFIKRLYHLALQAAPGESEAA